MYISGYKRADGKAGIRNKILIIAVDECCEGIAKQIQKESERIVLLVNYYTCMLGGNEETFNQMVAVGQNPNVACVLVVAMGCGSILPQQITEKINGKPTAVLTCEKLQGTRKSIAKGVEIIKKFNSHINSLKREHLHISQLVIGVKCGGSDTSSGLASNPAVGKAVDRLIDLGGYCIAGELFELIGCESSIKQRAASPEVALKALRLIENEKRRWSVEGTDIETMSIGNCVGGLTTIEEKSLGALHKTGSRVIKGVLEINKNGVEKPDLPGFYLSDATMLCGGSGVNFAAMGTNIILWTTGAAGFENEVVPVIRVSGNRELINEDIDIDATGIMNGEATIENVADKIISKIIKVANGEKTALEGVAFASMTLYQKDLRVEKLLHIK